MSRLRWMVLASSVSLAFGCSGGPAVPMPSLALPPPLASTTGTVQLTKLVAGKGTTLGDVADRLTERLERAGYADWSVYALSDDGFAIVTRIEAINDKGAPRATRFGPRRVPYRYKGFSLDDVRQVLFNESPGHYRLIVFAVTAHPLAGDFDKRPLVKGVDPEDLEAGKLPRQVRKKLAGQAQLNVLVYELDRPADASEPAALTPQASVSARDHLVGAGLFDKEELP